MVTEIHCECTRLLNILLDDTLVANAAVPWPHIMETGLPETI